MRVRSDGICQRMGWRTGNDNWQCPIAYRFGAINKVLPESKSGSLKYSSAGEPDGVPDRPTGVPRGAGAEH